MSTEKFPSGIAPDNHDLELLARGEHHDPHSVLGAHPHADGTVLRALRPNAESVSAVIGGKNFPLEHVSNGIFAALVPYPDLIDYRYSVTYPGGHTVLAADPYRFLPTLGELDLHLFGEGRHERLWDILGAHPRSYETPDGPVDGTSFAVWAPAARGVTVVGDFDGWSGQFAPCESSDPLGSGNSSCPTSQSVRCTSSGSTATTAPFATRPIPWHSVPRSRRRLHRE